MLGRSRRRARSEEPAAIDPWAVPEPWRGFVRQALGAQRRFAQAIASGPPGLLGERLGADTLSRLAEGVQHVWSAARQGAVLTGAGPSRTAQLSEDLHRAQAQRLGLGPGAPPAQAEAAGREEEAVAAQLRAARRGEAAVEELTTRLRLLTARLDEAVTSAVSLNLAEQDGVALAGWTDPVMSVVDDIDALHQGLIEVGRPEGPLAGGPPSLPPTP